MGPGGVVFFASVGAGALGPGGVAGALASEDVDGVLASVLGAVSPVFFSSAFFSSVFFSSVFFSSIFLREMATFLISGAALGRSPLSISEEAILWTRSTGLHSPKMV